MKEQTIFIGEKYCLKIEPVKYSETFPTQVYLYRFWDNHMITGKNWIEGTKLETIIQWADTEVGKFEKKQESSK
jgi:hypothetical protein